MIPILTRHWKIIATVLTLLLSGVAIYLEFFRGPKIVVVPQINTDSDIVFTEPNAVGRYEADYAQLMNEFLWCSVVETPVFAYYVANGYLSSEDLNKMTATRDQIVEQFKETLANVPIKVHIKNNAWRATTIESVEISIPSVGKMGPMGGKFEDVKTHVGPSKVDDLKYVVQIPVIFLMYGAMIDWVKKLAPPETKDSAMNAVLNAA